MITKISTIGMSQEEWLRQRTQSIGGSDASAIIGLNPYMSAYTLWAQKRGLLPPFTGNEATRIGHDLEEYVAARFTEATGIRVRRKHAILKNSDYPFAHANVDRLVIGEKAGLECKTTSVMNLKKFADGEFPATYYVQCQHYMMVTGLPKWYLAVLILGKEFLWFEIPRNSDEIDALAKAEQLFWTFVEQGIEPPIDGSASTADTLQLRFPIETPETEIQLDAVEDALERLAAAKRDKSEAEARIRQAESEIKEYMQDAAVGVTKSYKVTWRTQIRKAHMVKESQSRIFKLTERK